MNCISPIRLKGSDGKYRLFPCGRCCVCKSKKSSTWFYRLKIEQKHSFRSYFVTLDYDPEHVPLVVRDDKFLMAFKYKDVQQFHKVLREELRKNNLTFRFYLVSEYGTKGKRPHYHEILFLNPIDPGKLVKFPKSNMVNFQYYDRLLSKVIPKLWKYGQHTEISQLTDERMMYSAGYTQNDFVEKVEKLPNPNFGKAKERLYQFCDDDGVLIREEKVISVDKREFLPDPERNVFSKMSLKPGIGTQELGESFFNWYQKELPLTIKKEGLTIGMPALFKRKFKERFPDVAEELTAKAFEFMDHDINEKFDSMTPEQQQEQRKSVFMYYLKKSKKNKYKNL